MLRSCINVLTRVPANGVEIKCGNSLYSLEFVRWRRKPRWLPVAKSKIFRVPERKRQSPEERAELLRLHNNYKMQLRSVRQYIREEVARLEGITTADHVVLTEAQEEEEYERSVEVNDAWNKSVAEQRSVRLEKERQEQIDYVKERLEAAQVREEERLEEIEANVRRQKELSKTFIKRENLDAAIESALANPVDYNSAIDLGGNLFHGRTAKTPNNSDSPTTVRQDTEKEQLQATN